MQITNYNTSAPNFRGSIKNTDLFRNYALEYAKGIKIGDDDWTKLKMFINTVKAVKKDGTSNELIIDKIGSANKQLWQIKYGSYNRQDEHFKSEIYNNKGYGQDELARDAFTRIIQFGKEHFGLAELTKPVEEFSPANVFLRRADNFAGKSRQAKSRDVAVKLAENAKREENKAEEAISEIRTKLLCTI